MEKTINYWNGYYQARRILHLLNLLRFLGKEPEKPFKGSFNVRIGAELHRKAALAASIRGISLNAFVEDAIRNTVTT